MPSLYFHFNPLKRYHYYYLEPRSMADTLALIILGALIAALGLWLLLKHRPVAKLRPENGERP